MPIEQYLCTFFEFCAKTVAYSIKTAIFAGLFLFIVRYHKLMGTLDKQKQKILIDINSQSKYINY